MEHRILVEISPVSFGLIVVVGMVSIGFTIGIALDKILSRLVILHKARTR